MQLCAIQIFLFSSSLFHFFFNGEFIQIYVYRKEYYIFADLRRNYQCHNSEYTHLIVSVLKVFESFEKSSAFSQNHTDAQVPVNFI